MSTPSQTSFISDEDHAAEVAKQEAIAADVVKSTPQVAGTPAETPEEIPLVKLVPTDAVEEYPVTVTLPNYEDITFADASASAEVPPIVAEQVSYLANVAVAE